MKEFSKEEMFQLVDRHIAFELEKDIDGIMSTLCDTPYFEYHPMGYALVTRDAIEAKYRISVKGVWSRVIARTETVKWWNGDSVVLKDVVQCKLPDGRVATLNALAEFTFEGDKLKGENVYCNGEAADYQSELLKDFWSHPGVRKLCGTPLLQLVSGGAAQRHCLAAPSPTRWAHRSTRTAGFLVKPLAAAEHWSRAEIAFGQTIVLLTIAFTMPLTGAAVDRLARGSSGVLV